MLSLSPFDYIALSPWLSSLILMMSQVNSHAVLNHQFGCNGVQLTACGRAGAAGSGGGPAGRLTWRSVQPVEDGWQPEGSEMR